jgi:2-polyprenyl-3-methyl-5-hydroxy-6-metoxy-1,4-benzoquinol methylase
MRIPDTIKYYDENASDFFEAVKNYNVEPLYDLFLKAFPQGIKILDAGCGGGRDSKYFKDHGYDVTAFDASAELVKIAQDYASLPVKHMRFQDMNFDNEFDGIWASASLLHVEKSEIAAVMNKIYKALKPNGVLFASFRYGEGEAFEEERYFNDQTKESLKSLLENHNLEIIHLSIPEFLKSRRGFSFVVSLSKKKT